MICYVNESASFIINHHKSVSKPKSSCPRPFPMRRILFILILASLWACDTGEKLGNQAPDTRIFLDAINLTGENRLNSVVRLHWTGEDVDGYITGFELSLDGQQWHLTTKTDSTFRFDLQPGSDTTDISFWVRAIDNEEERDPDPANLIVPIKNSPPTARFDTLNVVPDTVYSVWSVLYSVDDLDGIETLDSAFIKLNDSPWYPLERNISFLTFLPENANIAGDQRAQLYKGLDGEALTATIGGLKVGQDNRMYLRSRDIAGSFSQIDTSKSFFVRTQQSDLLVIDAHGSDGADDVYFPVLNDVYSGYDLLNLRAQFPPFWEPTFGFLLNLYDKIFWYSDGAEVGPGQQLLIEVAAIQIQQYLNQGGKMFVTLKFPNSFNDPETRGQSLIFGFSPIDSLSSAPGQARLPKDSLLYPIGAFASRYNSLVSSAFIAGVDPFYPKDPANDMFLGQVIPVGGWTGPNTLGGRTLFSNGRTNQVFFSVELHRLNTDAAALRELFNQVLTVEFDW